MTSLNSFRRRRESRDVQSWRRAVPFGAAVCQDALIETLRAPALLAAAVLLVGACANGIPLHDDPRERARYEAYAGEPLKEFSWVSEWQGWQAIGRHELVVFTAPNEAYLLKVASPCQNLLLEPASGITSTATRTIYAHFDAVTTREGWRCPIEEIRQIDYRRMRADLVQNKQKADAAPAAAGSSAK